MGYRPWGCKESDMAERLSRASAGDMGLISGPGRSHTPRSDSPSTETREPVLQSREPQVLSPGALEPALCDKRSHGREKPAGCDGEHPYSPQLGKSPSTRRPSTAKNE